MLRSGKSVKRGINTTTYTGSVFRLHTSSMLRSEVDNNYPTKKTTIPNYKPEPEHKKRILPDYESPYSGPREVYNDSTIIDDAELWWQDAKQKEMIFDHYAPWISRGKALRTLLVVLSLIAAFLMLFSWLVPVVDHAAMPLPPAEVYDDLDPATQQKMREFAAAREERLSRQRSSQLGASPREVYQLYIKPKVESIKNLFREDIQ